MIENGKPIQIVYTNYKGETGLRKILPKEIHFGNNDWHVEPQWLLTAFDLEKNAERTFAMRDIRAWF